jgi:hypothetical protein
LGPVTFKVIINSVGYADCARETARLIAEWLRREYRWQASASEKADRIERGEWGNE